MPEGVQELLDAFERLRARSHRPVELLVAGNVRDSDDPRNEKAVYGRAALERMRGMSGVVYAGSLHPAQMREFFMAGDLFALPSLWNDPFPTAMVEAAAAGLPIVAAARGGVTEFLEGAPCTAFVSHPEDAEELAAALARYVDSASDRATAGRWLRERIVRHFDWQRVTDDLESLYDDLLDGSPA
ncbi:MAG: glycosyltransferase [Betaproteobacteria bacterium]|nr:glycosyltransferase [Betaproteobacteria bacterium]